MKNIKYQRAFLTFVALVFIAYLSFLITAADEETGIANSFFSEYIAPIFKYLFITIAYPCAIFSHFPQIHVNFLIYNLGLIFGCLSHSFLIEMILTRYSKYRHPEKKESF
ncbi:hypothetical protein AAFN85_24220 [Mucilaginibacter sp. CAU 1740]|uniref:hypothetical protein n=1 Tax=Mucilaginibacter sp. CAU 1740 TaxID=3140365 RepID=UPI00325C23FC